MANAQRLTLVSALKENLFQHVVTENADAERLDSCTISQSHMPIHEYLLNKNRKLVWYVWKQEV